MTSATSLGANDRAVLDALFDTEGAFNKTNAGTTDSDLIELTAPHVQAIQAQEKNVLLSLNSAQPGKGDIITALAELDAIIEAHPAYSSAYNNRAQTRRMLLDLSQPSSHFSDLKLILDDLSTAIQLSTPNVPTETVSAFDAKVLASAHSHRGYLLLSIAHSDQMAAVVAANQDLFGGLVSTDRLEEMASHELALGGKFGNDIARQLAVKVNPYAKLCGEIVREALSKEIECGVHEG